MKMVHHKYFSGSMKLILAGVVIYGMAGCSSTKPPDKAQTGAPAAEATKSDNNRMTGTPSESSSLDQLKKGGAVGTPSSSPLKDVYFDFDRYDLRADARNVLKANADWLKQNPSATVEIEGHCDERGTAEYNLALGAKRAQIQAQKIEMTTKKAVLNSSGAFAGMCPLSNWPGKMRVRMGSVQRTRTMESA